MVNVIVGGDVCPLYRNLPHFMNGDAEKIFNDLLFEFKEADLSVVNLECPLINRSAPILKNGPVLGVASESINGLKAAKIDVVNLANNHIMDHGEEGLKNTIAVCGSAKIATVGAGKNLAEARRMLIKEIGYMRIGILAFAEHEFSIAQNNSCGANPLDLIDFVRNVKSRQNDFDYLIVLLHGGNEHHPYPSPRLKDVCHFMVEMGANAVVVQHTHCPGCYEEYQNAHIVYGQGNLIFDWPSPNKAFYEGFLAKLLIDENLRSRLDLIPYVQSNGQCGANKMGKEAEKSFREAIQERSGAVANDDFLNANWLQFCERRKHEYFSRILGLGRVFSKLNSHGLLSRYFCKTRPITDIQNLISCEAHREVLETIFNRRMI